VAQFPSEALLLPHISYGQQKDRLQAHGGLILGMERVMACMLELTKAITASGLQRILIIGIDVSLLHFVAQRTMEETRALCGVCNGSGGIPAADLEPKTCLYLQQENPVGQSHICWRELKGCPQMDSRKRRSANTGVADAPISHTNRGE
jgi:hypothetical protein